LLSSEQIQSVNSQLIKLKQWKRIMLFFWFNYIFTKRKDIFPLHSYMIKAMSCDLYEGERTE
jgi:hypothetical protein